MVVVGGDADVERGKKRGGCYFVSESDDKNRIDCDVGWQMTNISLAMTFGRDHIIVGRKNGHGDSLTASTPRPFTIFDLHCVALY